jgi:hypothetical protein
MPLISNSNETAAPAARGIPTAGSIHHHRFTILSARESFTVAAGALPA